MCLAKVTKKNVRQDFSKIHFKIFKSSSYGYVRFAILDNYPSVNVGEVLIDWFKSSGSIDAEDGRKYKKGFHSYQYYYEADNARKDTFEARVHAVLLGGYSTIGRQHGTVVVAQAMYILKPEEVIEWADTHGRKHIINRAQEEFKKKCKNMK